MRLPAQLFFQLSAICIGGIVATQPAWASGYHFGTQSVSEQATANSSSAEAANPSTIFYNPAGLTYLPGTQIGGSLNLVMPSVKYSNGKGFYPGVPGAQVPIAGETSGKISKDVVAVPHIYLSHQIDERWSVGLGIYVPFASETEYSGNSVLRYNVNQTKLTSIDINPAVAFKLNDRHSLGFGIIAQHTSAELHQYANFGRLAAAAALRPEGAQLRAYMASRGMLPNYNGVADGLARIKGDDWGLGFNAGWLWDVNENVRLGVNYRSKIKHKLKGDAQWSYEGNVGAGTDDPVLARVVPGIMKQAGYVPKEAVKVDIVTPASLSLHGMWKVDPRWNLFGDVTWTQHSEFNKLYIQYANAKQVTNAAAAPGTATTSSTSILAPHWRNTFKVGLGASYQYSQPLQLRFGVAYDQSPVRSVDERLSTMPDNDRIWLSAGAKYDLSKNSTINVAYSYIRIRDGSANVNGYCGSSVPSGAGSVSCVSSRTNGSADYKSHAQILGVAYTYRF